MKAMTYLQLWKMPEMTSRQSEFDELLNRVGRLLDELADQQAMPDDSYKQKWEELRKQIEDCADDAFHNYSD